MTRLSRHIGHTLLAIMLFGAAACESSHPSTIGGPDAGTARDAATDPLDSAGTGGTRTETGGAPGTGGSARFGPGGGATSTGGRTGAGGQTSTGGQPSTGGGGGAGGATVSDGSAGAGGLAGADGSAPANEWWRPAAGLSWQWQIGGGTIDPSLAVDVFDIDWEEAASVVSRLHQAGKKVICYVSVGSWEDWRPDASAFPAAVLGNDYPGWPGERFVDIRAQALRDIMAKRLDVCRTKGFDAVEPDNMDVFSSNSGFPLKKSDGVDYASWLAGECHARGMAIVQKNASELTADIASTYDGALTEDCFDGGWCADMQPYIDANKPVLACEYTSSVFPKACAWGTPRRYSFILKSLELDAPVTFCP